MKASPGVGLLVYYRAEFPTIVADDARLPEPCCGISRGIRGSGAGGATDDPSRRRSARRACVNVPDAQRCYLYPFRALSRGMSVFVTGNVDADAQDAASAVCSLETNR
jgi:hypothetical protein